ncbi:MAG TPA: DNA-binding response regulator [Deltaproteobacteria bacterium]|nr:DNA-binding response regulator [Deltaproteobacteria bacterium]
MRALLIEDDNVIASFVVKGLKEAGFAVDHAADGEDGLLLARKGCYDVAIIDIMLPRLDGLTVITSLREAKQSTPVIILSAKDKVEDRVKGLQLGADDYLTKPFAFSELLARVQALIRRATGAAETTRLTVGGLTLDLLTREAHRDGIRLDLQPREFALLEFLVRNPGKVISRTMILDHVWNYRFDPETNVVEARMSRLRDKVDRNFEKKIIHTIRGVGYLLKESG